MALVDLVFLRGLNAAALAASGLGAFTAKRRVTLDSIALDAALSEQHRASVELTDHPVEGAPGVVGAKGGLVTDHVIWRPIELTIEGVISNTPLQIFGATTVDDLARTGLGSGNRDAAAWLQLQTLMHEARPITVTTTLATYDDMLITDLDSRRDAQRGNALFVTIKMREVRFVESETFDNSFRGPPGPKKKNLGRKTARPVPPAVRESMALKLGRVLSGGKL